jgi:hypothetical protein
MNTFKEDALLKESYYELVNLIKKYGIYTEKRHGNYVKLNYIDDSYFVLDTWNSEIRLKYNGITKYFGIDFGGFKLYTDIDTVGFYIKNIQYELGLIPILDLYGLELKLRE